MSGNASVVGTTAFPNELAGGRYRLCSLLGEGSKKRVYLARDTRFDRDVALALVKRERLDETSRERLRFELHAMGALGGHTHVVTLYDVGEEDGQPYIVSQLVNGGSLEDLLRRTRHRPTPWPEAVRLAEQICLGLDYAHQHGFIHRDLKPANIWLTEDDTVKLGDFGLATSLDSSRLTSEGVIVGTVAYMAPEQALGMPTDGRSDLYSLGVLLYELLTGRLPFIADDPIAVIYQHLNTPPIAPSLRNPEIPQPLEDLVLRLLAKTPDDRPVNASAVGDALATLADVNQAPITRKSEVNPLDRLASGLFVGREGEMKRLRAAFDAAHGGHGQLFLIAGEPGVGKSRTAAELAIYARMRGARVLEGHCHEGAGAPPFWPWLHALRGYIVQQAPESLRAQLGRHAVEIAQIIPEVHDRLGNLPAPPALDPERARFRFFDGLATFLRNASARAPIVVKLEDLHAADRSSLLLLQFLAREIRESRLMVIGTYRDSEVSGESPLRATVDELEREQLAELVLLERLGEPQVERFLELAIGRQPPAGLRAAVWAETDGNPLFVTEVVRLLASDGRLDSPSEDTTWRIDLPPRARAVIEQRLSRLSHECRHLLAIGSVIGREFGARLIEHAADFGSLELGHLLDEGLASQLIVSVSKGARSYSFSHALVREALYADLARSERLRLHLRIAEALESMSAADLDADLPALAFHFFAAAQEGSAVEKAIDYAKRAGDRAMAGLAYEVAGVQYERGLQALALRQPMDQPARCRLVIALGSARFAEGKNVEALNLFREAREIARTLGLTDELWNASVGYLEALWVKGGMGLTAHEEAIQIGEEALGAIGPGDGAKRSLILGRIAMSATLTGDLQRAMDCSSEAVAIARELGDTRAMCVPLLSRHWALRPSHVEERLAISTELIDCAERAGETFWKISGLQARLIDFRELGDIESANRDAGAYETLSNEIRLPAFQALIPALHASTCLLDGRLGQAEQLVTETFMAAQRFQSTVALSFATLQTFFLRREQGRFAEVEGLTLASIAQYPWIRAAAALLYAEVGRETEARSHFQHFAQHAFANLSFEQNWLIAMSMLAETCSHLADATSAEKLYFLLTPYARSTANSGSIVCIGAVSRYLGLLATTLCQWGEATRHFEDALVMHRRMGARPWLARTQRDYAAMLHARGNGADGTKIDALLDGSYEAAHEIGMTQLENEVAKLRQKRAAKDPCLMATDEPFAERNWQATELDRAFAERLDLGDLVAFVIPKCAELLDAERASLLLLDAEREELYVPEIGGDEIARAAWPARARFAIGKGIACMVARSGRAARVDDPSCDPRFDRTVDEAPSLTIRNAIYAPLSSRRGTIGVVQVVNHRGTRPFDDGDLELLERLAPMIAVAIENARRYAVVKTSEERLRAQLLSLRQDLARHDRFTEIVGTTPAMTEVFRLMESAAASQITVLIEGETGTGKELVARGIHRFGERADGPFLAINCAALSETLLESELFGHKRGAFTGANQDRRGLFESADGGTIFLDEIGEMPLAMQAKLLRVVQEGEIIRVGESRARKVDTRVISATNRDLHGEIKRGAFREDLYYRLAVFPIRLPALRERAADIPLLAQTFLIAAAERQRKPATQLDRSALDLLLRFGWPGNVRELQNEMERAVALTRGGEPITRAQLSEKLRESQPSITPSEHENTERPRPDAGPATASSPNSRAASVKLKSARDEFEASHIEKILRQEQGNVTRAAEVLGLSRVVLYRKLGKYRLR